MCMHVYFLFFKLWFQAKNGKGPTKNYKGLQAYITTGLQTGFARELQGVHEMMKS